MSEAKKKAVARRPRKHAARPIKTKRDFEGASAVARQLSGEAGQDSAAERRLQALLRELDKYEETEEEEELSDSAEDYDTAAPRRRWSDDSSDSDT